MFVVADSEEAYSIEAQDCAPRTNRNVLMVSTACGSADSTESEPKKKSAKEKRGRVHAPPWSDTKQAQLGTITHLQLAIR